jgi:hypothetical protein
MKLCKLVMICLLISAGLASCPLAFADSTYSAQIQDFGKTSGVQAEIEPAHAHLGTIWYTLINRTGTYKSKLGSRTINIKQHDYLFFKFRAMVEGNEKTQRGNMGILDMEADAITNGILITPNKWATLTTNPPFYYSSEGTHHYALYIESPDRRNNQWMDITVVVTSYS